MGSRLQVKADLAELSDRLRTVAAALKRLPADHASVPGKIEDLCEEVRAIAAKLRGH
jgi:DNA-binding transcriptional regulator YbjK